MNILKSSCLCLVFLLSLFTIPAHAEIKAYLSKQGAFSRDAVMIDGKEVKMSFGTFHLSNEMAANPQAAEFARLHEDSAMWGNIWLFGGLGLGLGYVATAPSTYNPTAYAGILLVGVFTGAYYYDKSRVYLYKAINTYNGIPVSPKTSLDLKVLPEQSSASVIYSF